MTLKSFIYRNTCVLQIIHGAWRMLWDYLVMCTLLSSALVWHRVRLQA